MFLEKWKCVSEHRGDEHRNKRNISIISTVYPFNSAVSLTALPALLCPSPASQDNIKIFTNL